MTEVVSFQDLPTSDLVVGAVYLGGSQKNVGDDPIAKLAPVGNQGGFRYKGSPVKNSVRLAVVYSSGEEEEWPDRLDQETQVLTYYGDNRSHGTDLFDTKRKGNHLLEHVFGAAYAGAAARATVPPFLLFEKVPPRRDVTFRGLLAPGVARSTRQQDLEVVWKTAPGGEFENYQARFTVLNVKRVPRAWIDAVASGALPTEVPSCPRSWRAWVESGEYEVLLALQF